MSLSKQIACAVTVAALYASAATSALANSESKIPPPAPGTYKLTHVQKVPFGIVKEGGSRLPHMLSTYTTGKITLLTFFYSLCTDPTGCPLAWEAFETIRERVKARYDLQGKVRLVFFSFDPNHDSPHMLKYYSDVYKADAKAVPWNFITAANEFFLKRTLEKFGQRIAIDEDASGEQRVVINHLLKIFLIDREGWIREIYTSQFLDPDFVQGDIETLLLEEGSKNLGN